MKLKDIIKLSAGFLGLDEVVSVLDDETQDNEYTMPIITKLTSLCNVVTGELSSSYLPLVRSDEVKVINGKISMTALQKRPTKILQVNDSTGKELEFSYDANSIYANTTSAKISYNYVAENYKLTDDVGYNEQIISKIELAYGVCAEYCLTERRFDEAVMWHERFVDAVKQRVLPKNVNTRARRWG